jgi:hypothetical protein
MSGQDWQDCDPRSGDALDSLDDRRRYVGTTLVYSDRYGPREFWRRGVQVDCICDPEAGVTCTDHAHTVNGWAYDPVQQAWTARVGPNRWLVVQGDLDDPPGWPPQAPTDGEG